MAEVPAEFLPKWAANFGALRTAHLDTLAVGLGALATIVALRRFAPKLPGFLIAIVLSAIVVHLLGLPVDTFGTRSPDLRSEEHTSELQQLMRLSYAVFC